MSRPEPASPSTTAVTEREAVCGVCAAACRVRVTLDGERLTEVRAGEDHPLAALCEHGRRASAVVHDPERVRTPLRRVGPKGSPEFEPIEWDVALDEIADRLRAIRAAAGPAALALFAGADADDACLRDLLHTHGSAPAGPRAILGSPNLMSAHACSPAIATSIAARTTFGTAGAGEPDLERAQLVMVWMADPAAAGPATTLERLRRAQARGARVVVLAAGANDTARSLGVQPVTLRAGTEGPLALGMIQVLVEEGLVAADFVRDWTTGWEELTQYVQHFRPEIVEDLTGVPAAQIRALARAVATAEGAAPVFVAAEGEVAGSVQGTRAVLVLWAVAGQLDVAGGLALARVRPDLGDGRAADTNRSAQAPTPAAIGSDRFPCHHACTGEAHVAALPRSVLESDPYSIRALVVVGGSLLGALPEPRRGRETLAALDLLVCIDRRIGADTAWADFVLPATTLYEIDGYVDADGRFARRERVVPPVAGARDPYFVLGELARRLGNGDDIPRDTAGRLAAALASRGLARADLEGAAGEIDELAGSRPRKWEHGGLRADGNPGFDTPSGRLEMASATLREHGYSALPIHAEARAEDGPGPSVTLDPIGGFVLDLAGDAPGRGRSAPSSIPRDVYLDHNATTPIADEVLAAMLPYLRERAGNPSSIHHAGTVAREALEDARRSVAATIGCTARRIVFTGGGSESDNLAIKGAALARLARGRHIITSAVEHPAVLAACRGLERFGCEITVLGVDAFGRVLPEVLAAALRPDTTLVSIMLANNEIGTLQPIRELAALAHAHGALFHTDAVQALGKLRVDVEQLGVDLLSISAHKVYGPKGVGALYVRAGVELVPQIEGGSHEHGLRAGTENLAGIVGFGRACALATRCLHADEYRRVARLRDRLEAGILAMVPDARVNGDRAARTPNTSNISLPEVRGESLVLRLDRHGLRFSSGSACKSGNPKPSHVLLAIGLDEARAHGAIRLSLGLSTSEADVDAALAAFARVLSRAQDQVRFVGCR